MVNKFNLMNKGFRIGGYGLSEPYVEDVRKKLTIQNPFRINCHYPTWEWVLRFETTHIRDKDEYVWIVYKNETADVLGTLRLMREIDERGWVDLIWSNEDGSEYKDEIHKDKLSASEIRRFIENRMHETYGSN
jgi:predicted DNA-binding transcriptional regulator